MKVVMTALVILALLTAAVLVEARKMDAVRTRHRHRDVRSAPGVDELKRIFPSQGAPPALQWQQTFKQVFEKYQINTCRRMATFLAVTATITRDFKDSNLQPSGLFPLRKARDGDPKNYKGRGPLPVIGLSQYQGASRALNQDFVTFPMRIQGAVALHAAGWVWSDLKNNDRADHGDDFANIRAILKDFIEGYNIATDEVRREWLEPMRQTYQRARSVLGCPKTFPAEYDPLA
jgi:predicted chitinase